MARQLEELAWVAGDLAGLAEELNARRPRFAPRRTWEPRIDVFEETDRVLVLVEIAGVRAEDVTLQYLPERNTLLLRGVRRDDLARFDPVGVHQLEIPTGEFSREVRLPDVALDPAGMRARVRHGLLLVDLPKRPEPRTTHYVVYR